MVAPAQSAGRVARPRDAHQGEKQYLYGVQGLRTVAAVMVAVYHIWFHRVSGGVDVFFVVAGYFATASMLKIVTKPGLGQRLTGVGHYLLRTARRVFPSATVVIVATSLGSMVFLSPRLWDVNIGHGIASMLFVENWYLIAEGRDYLAQDLSSSPFQQFWALGIQVQSYVLFPVLALSAAAIARLLGRSHRRVLLAVVVVIFGLSIAFSVYFTAHDQSAAYFHLGSRFWEFLAGAGLSLGLDRLRGWRPAASIEWILAALGWLGLVVVVSFAAVFDASRSLPGYIALIPILAAALIIVSSRYGVEPAVLKLKPMLWFADSSFAFYLWHWPLLAFYSARFGSSVPVLHGLAILVVAGILAVLTTRLVERPIRTSPLLQRSAIASILMAVLLMVPSYGSLRAWGWALDQRESQAWAAVDAALAGEQPEAGSFVPSTLIARRDQVEAYDLGCQQGTWQAEVIACEWGDGSSQRTIALVGGSHDTQWIDALDQFATQRNLRLISMTKGSCPFGDIANSDIDAHESCPEWIDNVTQMLLADPPDLVVTTGTRVTGEVEEIPQWKTEQISKLTEAGIKVVGVRDNPRFGFNPLTCLDEKPVEECYVQRSQRFDADLPIPELGNYVFVDMVDEYCGPEVCPVVDEGITSNWDGHHLTRTWTMLHSERITAAIEAALPD